MVDQADNMVDFGSGVLERISMWAGMSSGSGSGMMLGEGEAQGMDGSLSLKNVDGKNVGATGDEGSTAALGFAVPPGAENREVRVTIKLERFETLANSAERIRGQVSELVLTRAPPSPSARLEKERKLQRDK